ncbi:hypothetical protein [Bradyrhizobium sp. LA2.1]|uniref:hypothetical protein n=1 Tax=Bradyrhizobium sp. LA2.1 TaxID=3156376 RepID=UPI003395BAD4
MYEFATDQFLGINGLINFSNIVFLVAFSAQGVLKRGAQEVHCGIGANYTHIAK